jgi:hypothetical protein
MCDGTMCDLRMSVRLMTESLYSSTAVFFAKCGTLFGQMIDQGVYSPLWKLLFEVRFEMGR